MKQATHFQVHPGWKVLIQDMGLNPADVLALAGLPADLFARKDAQLSVPDYFAIWHGLETAAKGQELPLMLGQAISVEAFDPPIFACLCSANFNMALQRLSEFKRLVGPMILSVDIHPTHTEASIDCYQYSGQLPRSLGATELVFFTKLVRLATRHDVVPQAVTMTALPQNLEPYEAFFGTRIQAGSSNTVRFSAEDATRPFLTENIRMWQFFEPELKRRLSDLDAEAGIAQRVKSALLDMLPSGQSAMEQVAERLAMSKRTLQRRLNDESESYQNLLKNTRAELAQHYLANSSLTQGEISFLLGFQDTNSFIRAYSRWTGEPPGQFRSVH